MTMPGAKISVLILGCCLTTLDQAETKTYLGSEPPTFNDPDAPIICPAGSVKHTPASTLRELDPVRLADAKAIPPPGYVPARMLAAPTLKFPGNLFTRKPGFASIFIIVGPDGKAIEPQVVCSTGEKFERSAVDAVLSAEFAPGSQDGKSVEDAAIVPFDFKLR